MTVSRERELELRHRMLVAQARLQRLQLHHDTRTLTAALRPSALAGRMAIRVRARPSLLVLGLIGVFALRRWGLARIAGQAAAAWKTWRVVRGWFAG